MDFSQNISVAGLRTVTFIAPANGNYVIDGKTTLPLASQGSSQQSAVIVVVNKNGSPVMTTLAASEGFKANLQLLTTDTVTIVISSANAIDGTQNAVKTTLAISSLN